MQWMQVFFSRVGMQCHDGLAFAIFNLVKVGVLRDSHNLFFNTV
jgi:hypothetical protein